VPMAGHVAANFPLVVWNRTRAKAETFAATHGARLAATPREAVQDADVVVTCLPTSREVEQLLDGADGMFAGMKPGCTLVDCTSGDPATSQRIAQRLTASGRSFVDAPVSGGVSGAEKGALTIMCGGSEADLTRVRPVLATFGKKIVLCGGVGAGHAVKAVNQALLGVHLYAAAEGLAALVKAGVSPTLALEVINASSGRCNATENLIPQRVLTRAFPRTFRLALLEKDLGIAAEFARTEGVSAPVLQLTTELYRAARRELGEEADHVEIAKVVERTSGTEIRG
ncbi:MAG TPA: NAD(P)-dependent oxidoreductase, partial [Gemmatimonadaceae bacterium]|nr:NAD(P)-dependent oxidoreductase [Gemmatimonadaceae bacterium]